jgi:hypothetical protein
MRFLVSKSVTALTATALLALATSAFAADGCGFLGQRQLQGGAIFVSTPRGWAPLEAMPAVSERTPLRFAYVVQADPARDRTGVLAVKTNRQAMQNDREEVRRRVRLDRREVVADRCEAEEDMARRLPGKKGWVSTAAYEDYHDYPARDTAALREVNPDTRRSHERTLEAFHFSYHSGVARRCIRTDDESYDSLQSWNSNRAQFSYNRGVVAGGMYTIVGLFFGPRSPFEGNADHRTQMKTYSTSGGLACVQFTVKVDPGSYAFRINDLEGREKPPSKRRLEEKRWP